MEKVLNGGTRWRTGAGEDGNRSMSRSGEMHPKSHFWAFLRVVKVEKLWFDPFSGAEKSQAGARQVAPAFTSSVLLGGARFVLGALSRRHARTPGRIRRGIVVRCRHGAAPVGVG